MIDWHSHILPGMDDGSKDTAESISMLQMLTEQGVNTVIATPHFYANDESVEAFLDRRSKAFAQLPEGLPQILLGAEIRYYPGIGRLEELKQLCIEGSRLLLLEMPMNIWTEYTIRELIELAGKNGIQPVLAHVERYFSLQKRAVWKRLAESGILMQVNASFFISPVSRRRAVSLLGNGNVHFIGSDCHNINDRPPQLDKAYGFVEKKLGNRFISQMHEFGYSLLATNNEKFVKG